MGKLAVYRYISFMILVISTLLAIFTLFGLFGGSTNPGTGTALALLVYILPFLIIGNVIMLIYWLVRRKWIWLAIPAISLLCSIPYIGTIYQTGWFSEESEDAPGLRVATYNVELFGREISGFKAEDILTEMKKEKVDILCIQEYSENSGNKLNSESYKTYFPYMDLGRNDMAIFSRYPLGTSEIIDFGNTNNSGMWADVNINGKEVRIFNIHLETTGFNRTLHHMAKEEAKGNHVEENALLKAVYGNYTRGMAIRAQQADQVAREIAASDKPVILCGDFNDVPYSYVYNTVLGDLVDGFKECGRSGLMYTMRGRKFKVRIDYIFHSEELKGETYFRKEINYSDHYPVFMKIAL